MAITFKNLTKSNLSFLFSKLIPSLEISEDRNFSTRKGKFESGWGRGRKEQLHGIIIASILSTRHILSIHAGRPLHRRACVATRIFISLSPFSSPISFQCTPLIYRRALELYVPPAFTVARATTPLLRSFCLHGARFRHRGAYAPRLSPRQRTRGGEGSPFDPLLRAQTLRDQRNAPRL